MTKIVEITCEKCPTGKNKYLVDLAELEGKEVTVDRAGGRVVIWEFEWTCKPLGHRQIIEVPEEFMR